MKTITEKEIMKFRKYLITEEKSTATINKYVRDIRAFQKWILRKPVTKELTIEYKEYIKKKYKNTTVNSIIASLNCFLNYEKEACLKVKSVKTQRKLFRNQERELNNDDYEKLLDAAENDHRLYYLIQTICSTGIRVSELKYITAEALKDGEVVIDCKGKVRVIIISKKLKRKLIDYAKEKNIKSGSIFVTKTGKPLDRSNIWKMMKNLSKKAGVDENKVFPHNLRHLFARSYYKTHKNIVNLSNLLGHSSIETTRLYIMENVNEHKKQIENLGLIRT